MKIKFKSLKELLAYNIKYFRYQRGYSQEYLSELCRFSTRYLTDIERGKHCPTIDKIEIIAQALKITPDELFVNINRDKNIVNKINNTRQYNQKNTK